MSRLRRIVAVLLTVASLAPPAAGAKDLAAMPAAEISQLQRRLTDAGCYTGAIDGAATPALAAAVKACPDQEPVLRIETGMHTAAINMIAANADCTLAATASDDKTVRLWSLPAGTLRQTLRLPIGGVEGGRALAIAISPDGRTLAVSRGDGYVLNDGTKASLILYTLDTGGSARPVRILTFESRVLAMAFNREGNRLALGFKGPKGDGVVPGAQGLRVLDLASGTVTASDPDYGDDIYGLAFAADGSLVTSSWDGFLRRYDAGLTRTAKKSAPGGKRPSSIALDPTGRMLAVGYADTTAVSVLDAVTLTPKLAAANADLTNGDLGSVAWSQDGRLWAAGSAQAQFNGQWRHILRSFGANGKPAGRDQAVAANTVSDLKSCGDGLTFAAADLRFGLVDRTGTVTALQAPVTADMRGKTGDAFRISDDGTRLSFGLGYGRAEPVAFDLRASRLSDAPTAPAGLSPAKVDGLKIKAWNNTYTPTLDGSPLALTQHEFSRSLAIAPDRSGFVLGTGWNVRGFDASGRQRWAIPAPGVTWGVNLARSGKLVAAGHGDGTIRWYRGSDGKELLALFIHKPTRRWIAWTPSGYYMASPGAEDLIGWHVNRGWEQVPDFFPADRFRDRFSRPDIVQTVLETLDEQQAIRAANDAARRKEEAKPIIEQLPPVIRITGPAAGTGFTDTNVTLAYELRSPSGLPVDRIDVLIDGQRLDARGVGRADPPPAIDLPTGPGTLTVALPTRDVDIALIARAGDLASTPTQIRLTYAGKPPAAPVLKPKLYVLAIGISDYEDTRLRLGLAAKDAGDFVAALKAQSGGLYRAVEVKLLPNKEATRKEIKRGFAWLRREVTPDDVAMVFMAGHGQTNGEGFWFLPTDTNIGEDLSISAISQGELRNALTLGAKTILFLDACHAADVGRLTAGTVARGNADLTSVINDLKASNSGVVIFAASQGRELSLENDIWGNGAFTKAVVEGIREGKADFANDGDITLTFLHSYISRRVKALTDDQQHPAMEFPITIRDFAIATVRRG